MNDNNFPASLTDIFGPIISAYTRAQAIADRVLVEVPELDAAIAGFIVPMAVNASVWAACRASEQESRALMLAQARKAVGAFAPSDDRIYFNMVLPSGGMMAVVLHIGPGDATEPVLTLCEPCDL